MIEKRGLLRVFLIHVRVATIFLFERKRKAKIGRQGREKFSSENLFVTTVKLKLLVFFCTVRTGARRREVGSRKFLAKNYA